MNVVATPLSAALGQFGCVILTSAAASASGEFHCITALADGNVKFKLATGCTVNATPFAATDLVTLAVPAGVSIYGRFTYVECDTCSFIAYKAQ